jgi:chorismate synthase
MPTSPTSNGVADDISDESPITPFYLSLLQNIARAQVDSDPTRCPDSETAKKMSTRILEAKNAKDSIGGTITCVIRNVPAGLGEPCFDKLEAKLAHAMLSIPATKGFEIGSGFASAEVPASKHNDPYVRKEDGTYGTLTNNSGGIQGGISNGENIFFKVAFKSPATISQPQSTAKYDGITGVLAAKGRHDPCVVPRAIPIVETMAALVIMEYVHWKIWLKRSALLIQQSRQASRALLPPMKTNLPTSETVVDGQLAKDHLKAREGNAS